VSLSSSSPAATVPASMTIAAGAGGDQFPITTTPVTKVTQLTIRRQLQRRHHVPADHAHPSTDAELTHARSRRRRRTAPEESSGSRSRRSSVAINCCASRAAIRLSHRCRHSSPCPRRRT
jgi:hypothetical protein